MSEVLSMNEITSQELPAELQSPSPNSLTAGQLIRRAREANGLHIAALAVSLKVSVKKLEALEADQLDQIQDPVFVRGLASSVCRALKIDPTPVLALMRITNKPVLGADESGMNLPFHASGPVPGKTIRTQLSRPVVLGALALLCGALVLFFSPVADPLSELIALSSEVAAPPPSASPAEAVAIASSLPVKESPNADEKTSPAPAVAETPPMAPPVRIPEIEPPKVSAGILVFSTRSPSWVEVTDINGVVLLRKTIVPAENVAISGAVPLSVVVGRADVTEVLVRGRPFSIASFSKDNVARFEVK